VFHFDAYKCDICPQWLNRVLSSLKMKENGRVSFQVWWYGDDNFGFICGHWKIPNNSAHARCPKI
jgi:hypothetical protein